MSLDLRNLPKEELIVNIETKLSLMESLASKVDVLTSRLVFLEEENRTLKLKLDSSNSSRPPSSDGGDLRGVEGTLSERRQV